MVQFSHSEASNSRTWTLPRGGRQQQPQDYLSGFFFVEGFRIAIKPSPIFSSIPSMAMAPATDLSLLTYPGPTLDVGVQTHIDVQY